MSDTRPGLPLELTAGSTPAWIDNRTGNYQLWTTAVEVKLEKWGPAQTGWPNSFMASTA